MRNSLPKDFTDRIDFHDDCWLWKPHKNSSGYGIYHNGEKQVRAHRYAWEHFNGDIPEKLHVLHKCDIRHCVNPSHLFLGTNADNVSDRVSKGRSSKGETAGTAKLTQIDVDEIRRTYQKSKPGRGLKNEFSLRGLSEKYGVAHEHIGLIVRNKIWIS